MKYVSSIPRSSIAKLAIVVTSCRKSLAEVKAETGADYILNGGMWNPDGSPCVGLKADGKLLSKTPWGNVHGYGWTGTDIHMTLDWRGCANYLAVSPIIKDGAKYPEKTYDSAQDGVRGRSAIGLTRDALVLYCSGDRTSDAKDPDGLTQELLALGCDSAMMLDSGGSSQCDFAGKQIKASRKVHNWICIWTKEVADTPPDKEDKPMDEITSSIMTGSACYKAGRTITPRGIMVHSTATPGVMADKLRSAWNSAAATAAVHGIIDDSQTLQTLPWTCRSWHAGNGTSGKSANDTHISFEICEPVECHLLPEEWVAIYRGNSKNPAWAVKRLQMELQARGYDPKGVDGSFGPGCEAAVKAYQADAGLAVDGSCGPATRAELAKRTGSYLAYDPKTTESYFQAVWSRAVSLCAKLCKDYGLDPMADILCHSEGYRRGIASNHADVEHWFPKHGRSMDDFRREVKEKMEGKTEVPWYTEAQNWAKELGIADGTRPEEAATRAEVWTMLQKFDQRMKGE